jgi:hypothetical protein
LINAPGGFGKAVPLGKRVVAVRSGHFLQFTKPELVVAAVKEAAKNAMHAQREGARA